MISLKGVVIPTLDFLVIAGNDTIIAGGGSDVIDGGQGRDTVIFSGQRSGFTLVMNEDSATLRSSELSNDSISLRNIERLSFLRQRSCA
jgi:Ca2+-binding RTX toxin-like protein